MSRRVARLEKERCLMVQLPENVTALTFPNDGGMTSAAKQKILDELVEDRFKAAQMATTPVTWVEENGKFVMQTVEGQEWNQAQKTSFTTNRTYFVDLFKELKPEDIEFVNARSNNWHELVLHFGHKMARLMDWTRGNSTNIFKKFGSGVKVKCENLFKQEQQPAPNNGEQGWGKGGKQGGGKKGGGGKAVGKNGGKQGGKGKKGKKNDWNQWGGY
eukprot:g4172.t1